MAALSTLLASRLLGAPVPSGVLPEPVPVHALEVPWPLCAMAAGPFGLLAAGVLAAMWLGYRWCGDVKTFTSTDSKQPPQSQIGTYYGTVSGDPDSPLFAGSRRRIARAWATARVTDRIPGVALALTVGMVLALVLGEMLLALAVGWTGLPWRPDVSRVVHGVATAESTVGLFLAGFLVTRLRSAYKDPAQRKVIGALWDVGTFWPRAAHPFAPPCYAERAVPELVDRIRVLTGTVEERESDPAWWSLQAHMRDAQKTEHLDVTPGPLLLTGYSQGSVIAPAVVAQLPEETVKRVALQTLACPARRLYGRAFPAYFGPAELAALASRLTTPPAPGEADPEPGAAMAWSVPDVRLRWRNLVRETDYIGSWVSKPNDPNPLRASVHDALDLPSWDPPAIAADDYPTPAPIHRHSDFWQDPRTTELSEYLIGMLHFNRGVTLAEERQSNEAPPPSRGC
jgi:hypothetical protein